MTCDLNLEDKEVDLGAQEPYVSKDQKAVTHARKRGRKC